VTSPLIPQPQVINPARDPRAQSIQLRIESAYLNSTGTYITDTMSAFPPIFTVFNYILKIGETLITF
jgi:hypothetical protein